LPRSRPRVHRPVHAALRTAAAGSRPATARQRPGRKRARIVATIVPSRKGHRCRLQPCHPSWPPVADAAAAAPGGAPVAGSPAGSPYPC